MNFHITPLNNLQGILSQGILINPPQQNFSCGPRVFITASQEDALLWAGEIARQSGQVMDFALIAVAADLSAYPFTSNTEIGATQAVVFTSIPPEFLTHAATFLQVEPIFNISRLLEESANGWRYCTECERNIKDEKDVIEMHLEMFHDEEED